ncbi:MAG TPA: TonB-dependent receptor [Thermoanaerobaculia bacterium]|nr:TonB-dependent receptor [Thermoanaerobaculia bacterium]
MRRRYGSPLAAALAITILQSSIQAQEPQEPAGTFYSTATVRERPLSSATGSVTVLDRDAIQASGARTVADVLRFVPGLDVTTNGTRGGLSTAQIRGGDPNFTLVLLDGVPLNDPTYQVGDVYNLEGLAASAVERVEIVRGPLSSFYGSTGLAGAINIVTRQGQPGPPAVELEVAAGDASLRQAQGSVSGALGAATYFVGGGWEEESRRIADERFRQSSVHANFAAPLGRARLQVKTRWADWLGDDYPDASGGLVYGSGELRRSDHQEASIGSELTFGGSGGDRQKISLALYRHDRDTDSPAVFPQVPPSLETTRYTVARAGWTSILHDARGVRLSAGADVQREKGENESVLLLPPEFGGRVEGDYEITRTLPGAFAELVMERGGLVVEAASRFDVPEDRSRQWSPRLGVSWRPGEGSTRWHASAGRAWKQPSFFALASPPQLGGNPDLRAEKVLGGDFGIERSFAAARLEAGVTLFYNRYDDLIDFDFETFTHLNRSEVEAQGVETTVGWTPLDRLSLRANATWQQVEDRTTHARLRHRPKWVGGARLDWRPSDRLSLQLDAQTLSESFDEQIPVPERDTVPGYGLIGLAGTWRLAGPWEIHGRIDNLADREYETLIGFPGAGRSVRIGLRYGGRS